MKQAKYILETHTIAGVVEKQEFEGTRKEARAACRKIDTNRDSKRKAGQTTHARFVKYVEVEV